MDGVATTRIKNAEKPNAMARRRLMEKITLLCDCGAGLEAIVSPLCSAIRALIGADAISIFWLDAEREPRGFYHDSAPAEIKDFFVNHLDELFTQSDEATLVTMTLPIGISIGKMLDRETLEAFWRGNVYKYLCTPLGHRFMLDMRVEVDGIGRALVCCWNVEGHPFSVQDVDALVPVQAAIQRAIGDAQTDVRWRNLSQHTAHFITDLSGETLLAIDDEAERILMAGHLLQQNISMAAPLGSPPGFARQLAAMLHGQPSATMALPVADGRLVARAVPSKVRDPARGPVTQMFVSVALDVALDVLMIDYLAPLPLTLLQKRIALAGMQGKPRSYGEEALGISAESLKKHLRTIFDVTGTTHWADLALILADGG